MESDLHSRIKKNSKGGCPMEMTKITKQMIAYQKAAVDQTFQGMTIVLDYSETVMNTALKQFPWVTEEARKPLNDSMDVLKKTRDEYKKVIDQGFAKLEEMTEMKEK
jgi:hypothetical protein